MNFLSHYYFERYAVASEQVLGGLLPDFLKNVDKSYSFPIHKLEDKLTSNPDHDAITIGWQRHVEVDKIFHGADYFYDHTHRIRKEIEGSLADLPIRASFMAHIALELLLDHKLIVHSKLGVGRLYEHLEHVDRKSLTAYLRLLGDVDVDRFYRFYDRFIESKYIFEYAKVENIPHALFNICKRIWQFEPQTKHYDELAQLLDSYQRDHLTDYALIYTHVGQLLEG